MADSNDSSNAMDNEKKTLEVTDFTTKHPLQNQWTWWYDSPNRKTTSQTWVNYVKKVYSFATVEDFWCLYNNIKPAHEITAGSSYHLFKDGIEPKWEDAANKNGGCWVVHLPNKQREQQLEQLWLFLILACIGENFSDSDQICGAVVSVRKGADRIQLWTRDAHDDVACKRIGEEFKNFLGLQSNATIGYITHADALQGKKTALYTI